MTPLQRQRLAALAEKLADDVLQEADPDNWPGANVDYPDWDPKIRGDRYWMKKNAAASLVLLDKVERLAVADSPPDPTPGADAGMDRVIADAERAAAQLVDKALRKAGNRARAKQ